MTGDRTRPYIHGVYNYCDRWCERCPLTDRCQLYSMEPPTFATPETRDPRQPAFWNELSLCFAQANRRLREDAAAAGRSSEQLRGGVLEATMPEARDDLDRVVHGHPLVVAAGAYGRQVDRWFDTHDERLAEQHRHLAEIAACRLAGREGAVEVRRVEESIEIVLWYQQLIEIKLALAVATRVDLEQHGTEDEPYAEHMMNGAAKVALLAVDSSLSAWRLLREAVDDPSDAALPMLSRLDRLRRDTEAAFPSARAFERPGFDTSASAVLTGNRTGRAKDT